MKTSSTLILLVAFQVFFSCKYQNSDKKDTFKANDRSAIFAIHPKIHNFGDIESGERISFSFDITNSGTGNLVIDSINGGCGCIETKIESNTIEPGKNSYLEILFNSSGEWGNIVKPVIVHSNAGKDTIYLTAKVSNKLFN